MIEGDDENLCGVFYHPQFEQYADPPLLRELKRPKSENDRDFVEYGDICACVKPTLSRCKITRVYTDGNLVQLRRCNEHDKIESSGSNLHTAYKKDLKLLSKMDYTKILLNVDEERSTQKSVGKKREPSAQTAPTLSSSSASKKQKQADYVEDKYIARCGKGGNILAVYESISDAVSRTSTTRTQIMNYLAGKRGTNHCGQWAWKRPTVAEVDKFRSSTLVVEEFELASGNVKRRFLSVSAAAEELGIPVSLMKDRCKDRFYQSPYGLGYNIVRMSSELARRDPLMHRPHCFEIHNLERDPRSKRFMRVNKRRLIGGNLVDHIDFWRGDIVQTRFGNGEIVGRSEVLPNTTMYKLRHNVSKYPLLFSMHSFEKN